MNLVVIFGPPAVGKMTVGHELARQTGLRLFHNHMTLDVVAPIFDFGSKPFRRLVSSFRQQIFEEVAASDLPGLIFTYVWALDLESDKNFVDRACAIFREKGANVYFVELEAGLDTRLRRNESEFRLSQKTTKRDLEKSRQILMEDEQRYRMNSRGDFFYPENHLKIQNGDLNPEDVARQVVAHFKLPNVEGAR
jgi:hypothetical protein